jgi:GTP-binding protein
MLVDRALIQVRSGRGGNGFVSFRREKFVPKGGPDGGDGGRGGSIFIEAITNVDTLMTVSRRHAWMADDGQAGQSAQCHGADGADLVLHVPPGTLVYDDQTDELLADLDAVGRRFIAAHGGTGGFGNEHFKSATNQAPAEATQGQPAEQRMLRLELKLIADVGIIGLPNAGKSTLLATVSAAKPKVADYPFTTLEPHLGIVELDGRTDDRRRRMIIADIPGLIEGAHDGKGLGHAFLRHIERTRVLIHLVGFDPAGREEEPARAYAIVRRELEAYSPHLAAKPQVVALSKADLITDAEQRSRTLQRLEKAAGGPVHVISAATHQGVRELLETSRRLAEESQSEKTSADGWPARQR